MLKKILSEVVEKKLPRSGGTDEDPYYIVADDDMNDSPSIGK